MSDVYYFGCWGDPALAVDRDGMRGWPAPTHQPEGAARLTLDEGWWILAWWDRRVDQRYGANSAFLVREAHATDLLDGKPMTAEVLGLAREHFPRVMARFSVDMLERIAGAVKVAPR